MKNIRFLTAGESHGQGLVGILEGMPAGLDLNEEEMFQDLRRRQMGHGRGGRMKIEKDRARILSGVRFGKTLGSPIGLLLENRDWENWKHRMSVGPGDGPVKEVVVPRPGHADYAGAVKYGHGDLRNVLERASARETAMRVAIGAIARKLLARFSITVVSHVLQIHTARTAFTVAHLGSSAVDANLETISERADASSVRCLDPAVAEKMVACIDAAKSQRDTVGGIFEVVALNLPVGLGSHVHWDRKLDARIGRAMMSIPAMKGVEIGPGFEAAGMLGSEVHDPIYYDKVAKTYSRSRNHAGGLEGGITNGMPLVVRVAMKPISTLLKPLDSVNMSTKEKTAAHIERSDICAVPAASVVGEAALCLVLADALIEKFGGDSISEIAKRYASWIEREN